MSEDIINEAEIKDDGSDNTETPEDKSDSQSKPAENP